MLFCISYAIPEMGVKQWAQAWVHTSCQLGLKYHLAFTGLEKTGSQQLMPDFHGTIPFALEELFRTKPMKYTKALGDVQRTWKGRLEVPWRKLFNCECGIPAEYFNLSKGSWITGSLLEFWFQSVLVVFIQLPWLGSSRGKETTAVLLCTFWECLFTNAKSLYLQ